MPGIQIGRRAKQLLFRIRKPFLIKEAEKYLESHSVPELGQEEEKRFSAAFLKALRVYGGDLKRFSTTMEVIRQFYGCEIRLLRQSFRPEELTADEVIVVSVVNNDRLRAEAFLKHYRSLGAKHFLILERGSRDGSREYLEAQEDVNLFFYDGEFSDSAKDAWVNRMLAFAGRDHWYYIADVDELGCYIGMERHSLAELAARIREKRGAKRGKGILIDMYPEGEADIRVSDERELLESYCYFDSDSYVKAEQGEFISHFLGGPRARAAGLSKEWMSKCPLVYFDAEAVVINAHFQFPLEPDWEAPMLFFVRHFKFYVPDRAAHQAKEGEKYQVKHGVWDASLELGRIDYWYPGSRRYEGEASIGTLPFFEDAFGEEG